MTDRTRSHTTTLAEGGQPMGPIAMALALLISALWGGTPVAIRYSVDTLPPVAVAAIRFVMAAAVMLVWCRLEGTKLRLTSGQVKPTVVLGFLLFFQIALFNLGIRESSSSHATLFINTFVFWVAGIEHFVTGNDPLSPRKWLGLMLAVGGVVLVLGGTAAPHSAGNVQDVPTLAGDAILLASAVLLGIKIVYTKHAVRTVEPSKLILWHDVIGVALFAGYSYAFEEIRAGDFNTPAVLGLLYQGVIVAGLCFAIQTELLRRHPAWQVSVFSCATPLFGIAAAAALRGDGLSWWLLVSGIAVTAGILVVTTGAPAMERNEIAERPAD